MVEFLWSAVWSLFSWLIDVNFKVLAVVGGGWFAMFIMWQVWRFLIAPFVSGVAPADDNAKGKYQKGKTIYGGEKGKYSK